MGLLSIFKKNNATNNVGKIELLSAEDFKKAVQNKSVQLVDVRTKNEVMQGKISNAKHIDFFSSSFQNEVMKLNLQQPVYVYCRSGNRSAIAAREMISMGYTDVSDFGGIIDWFYDIVR